MCWSVLLMCKSVLLMCQRVLLFTTNGWECTTHELVCATHLSVSTTHLLEKTTHVLEDTLKQFTSAVSYLSYQKLICIKINLYNGLYSYICSGDSLTHHNGKKWTTYDQDNDLYSSANCAVARKGNSLAMSQHFFGAETLKASFCVGHSNFLDILNFFW